MSEDNFDDEFDGSLPSGPRHPMARRFRGYLPVVVDVETGGFNSATDALLEIAATTVGMDEKGFLFPEHTYFFRIEPFEGANIEPAHWNSPASSLTTRCAWRCRRKRHSPRSSAASARR